ncbi:hypothetical protein ACK8HX_06060 [Oryzobacter sp. R7]|uniref:hypothetical protein n=1 Tax=Oryzobacter faecalis TaxID=3388656 RepID=UPI00398CD677
MPHQTFDPPYDQLLATAERVARERPEVDRDLALEVFEEAARLLHDGLALDGLDEHDARAVVGALCEDLVSDDPGQAVRARADDVIRNPGDLHDPTGVSASLAVAVTILQL